MSARSGQVEVSGEWVTFQWEHCDLPLYKCRACRIAYQAGRRLALGQKVVPLPRGTRRPEGTVAKTHAPKKATDVEVLLFGLRALAAYKGVPTTKSSAALMRSLRADFAMSGEADPSWRP